MRGSLTLLRVAGIRIAVHWTFVLILLWVMYLYAGQTETDKFAAAIHGLVFVLAVFACVVLHELGHALTAKRFGINTKDITLLPIGGVARLERMPEDPTQELVVAIMGPVVNVVIAGAIFAGLILSGHAGEIVNVDTLTGSFWAKLMWVNGFLVAFNLLPAFPMDGGRVLRALLHYNMDYAQATRIAAIVGQAMAFMFGIAALFIGNLFLVIIAIFVYLGAAAESRFAQTKAFTNRVPLRNVMITNFKTLSPGSTLEEAITLLLRGEQQDFPVTDNGHIAGVLTRTDLMHALEQGKRHETVGQVMRRECENVEDSAPLDQVFERMRSGNCPMYPVTHDGQLVGIITAENVAEWIMIQSALQHK